MPGMAPDLGGSDVLSMMAGGGAQPQGADQARSDLEATINEIRDLDQQVQDLAGKIPAVAQEAQQIRGMLKQMILKAAKTAPTQTASADAVPMAGS